MIGRAPSSANFLSISHTNFLRLSWSASTDCGSISLSTFGSQSPAMPINRRSFSAIAYGCLPLAVRCCEFVDSRLRRSPPDHAQKYAPCSRYRRGSSPPQAPPKPAVPIRRSVGRDYVICLECGYRARTLRRHLRRAHGLDVTDYRTRWNLPAEYPLIAPSYSARRSTLAKEVGLGRKPSGLATPPTLARRGRKPRITPAG